jgi:hypothetical protein
MIKIINWHWSSLFSMICDADNYPPQRNLNNCFAYDLVPSVEVLSAALRAARRVNDFPTAVRIFEGALLPLWFTNTDSYICA